MFPTWVVKFSKLFYRTFIIILWYVHVHLRSFFSFKIVPTVFNKTRYFNIHFAAINYELLSYTSTIAEKLDIRFPFLFDNWLRRHPVYQLRV